MSPDILLFPVTDALQMELHLMDNKFRGCAVRDLEIGLWRVKTEISVCSDELSQDTASFFVRVTAGLWLYMISRKSNLQILVFDGGSLGLKVKDMAGFGTGKVNSTIGKLPTVKAGFTLSLEGDTTRNMWSALVS
jgi:hypothetical protein